MLKKQTQWFSTSSFAHAIGHFGSAPNGVLLSPGLELWDLSAIKNLKFGDRVTFQLRGEFFNAFNHTNFGQPSLSGAGSGLTRIVVISGRLLQHTTPAKYSLEASCISKRARGALSLQLSKFSTDDSLYEGHGLTGCGKSRCYE